jgi:hypothetical protein
MSCGVMGPGWFHQDAAFAALRMSKGYLSKKADSSRRRAQDALWAARQR